MLEKLERWPRWPRCCGEGGAAGDGKVGECEPSKRACPREGEGGIKWIERPADPNPPLVGVSSRRDWVDCLGTPPGLSSAADAEKVRPWFLVAVWSVKPGGAEGDNVRPISVLGKVLCNVGSVRDKISDGASRFS